MLYIILMMILESHNLSPNSEQASTVNMNGIIYKLTICFLEGLVSILQPSKDTVDREIFAVKIFSPVA